MSARRGSALLVLALCGCPGELRPSERDGGAPLDARPDAAPAADAAPTGPDAFQADAIPTTIDPERMHALVAELASDYYGGRAPDTLGNRAAVNRMVQLFGDLGLRPAGDAGTFRQAFPLVEWKRRGADLAIGDRLLVEGDEFRLLPYSGGGTVSGALVFAGHGLTLPSRPDAARAGCALPADPRPGATHDDYAGLDVAGRIAVVLAGPPPGVAPGRCPLARPGPQAANARRHGAVGLILVERTAARAGAAGANAGAGAAGVETAGAGAAGARDRARTVGMRDFDPDFPVAIVDADALAALAPDLPISADGDPAVAGRAVTRGTDVRATLAAQIETSLASAENVLGAVPGADPALADEVVVIGAHLDHLGRDPETDELYPGADDDASGVAVTTELARVLLAEDAPPARTVLFAAWNAEELGLIGSCYYVEHPTYPVAAVRAMVSVDMVGAGDGSGLILYGAADFGDRWVGDLFRAGAARDGLWSYQVVDEADLDASDHVCFQEAGVSAVLALTLGPHASYHTPADTADTVLREDLEAAARLLWAALRPLARGEEELLLGP